MRASSIADESASRLVYSEAAAEVFIAVACIRASKALMVKEVPALISLTAHAVAWNGDPTTAGAGGVRSEAKPRHWLAAACS